MPTSGVWPAVSTAIRAASASSTASLFRRQIHSPEATAKAWLLPRAKPVFASLRMIRIRSPYRWTASSADPSCDPLSTRITSRSGHVCARRDWRHSRRKRAPLRFTTTAETRMPGPRLYAMAPLARNWETWEGRSFVSQANEPRATCPSCNSVATAPLWPVTDRLFRTTTRKFWIRRCRRCSIEYLHPLPTAAELATYYPEAYWTGSGTGSGVLPRLMEMYRRLALFDHVRFVRRIVREQRAARSFVGILDVGCGDGSFLEACGVRSALGLDWSHTAVQAVRARGFPAVRGTLSDAPFRDGTFSIVTMFHYLEHVASARDHLGAVRRLLRRDGKLVVQVPNADSWQRRILRSRWAGYDPPRHLVNYSTETLARTLTEHGFQLVRRTHLS